MSQQPASEDTPQDTHKDTSIDASKDPIEEEWTFVKRKGRSRNNKSYKPSSTISEPSKPRTENLRSLQELQAEYHKIKSQWEQDASSCSRRLCEIVTANASPLASSSPSPSSASTSASSPPKAQVTQAICLGIGTFDPADGAWEAKRRTYMQLIAFLIMVEELEKITNEKIKCYFQEPIFTSSDKSFITSLGHEILEPPAGCEMVNSSTLLFAVHLYRPIYAMALKKESLPAVFVGTGWDVWDQVTMTKSNDLDGMKKMDETYITIPFPQDPGSTAFSSTLIYWRPVDADNQEKYVVDKKTEPVQDSKDN